MIETGKVISVNSEVIQIRLTAGDHCSGCNLCNSLGGNGMILELPYVDNIQEGALVELEIPDQARVKTGFLLFIVPLLCFAAGVVVSDYLGRVILKMALPEVAQLVTGIVCMGISFILLYFYGKRVSLKETASPRIIRVI